MYCSRVFSFFLDRPAHDGEEARGWHPHPDPVLYLNSQDSSKVVPGQDILP